MAAKTDLRVMSHIYETEMSEGDRSCFLAMLKSETATQMTIPGSSHGRFYEELALNGWAERETAPAALQDVLPVQFWRLTEAGKRIIPTLMFAMSADYERRQIDARRTWHMSRFSALLIAVTLAQYSAVFLGVGSLLSGGALFVLNAAASLILVGVLAGSIYGAIWAWAELPVRENPMARMGRLEFLRANRQAVAMAMAAAVVLIWLGRLGLRLWLTDDVVPPAKVMLQVVVHGALGFMVAWFLGPALVEQRRSNMFRHQR